MRARQLASSRAGMAACSPSNVPSSSRAMRNTAVSRAGCPFNTTCWQTIPHPMTTSGKSARTAESGFTKRFTKFIHTSFKEAHPRLSSCYCMRVFSDSYHAQSEPREPSVRCCNLRTDPCCPLRLLCTRFHAHVHHAVLTITIDLRPDVMYPENGQMP